ncbi:MAG: type VII secretion protein EssC, partial [Synergistaceae bacterium]|nr:type VII secretion protein EssC [Synergistaceae bacterium]
SCVFMGGWKFVFRDDALNVEHAAGNTELSAKFNRAASARAAVQYPFFQRSPHIKSKAETCKIEILSPPSRGAKPSISWLSVFLPPVLMATAMLAVAMFTGNKTTLLFIIPMSSVSVVMAFVNYRSQMKKWKQNHSLAQKKYHEHLQEQDNAISAAETSYLLALAGVNPGIKECVDIAARIDRRLWQRALEDEDFLEVRLGAGQIRSNVEIKIPQEQIVIEEDPLLAEAKSLKERHVVLSSAPITHSFLNTTVTGIVGDRNALQEMAWTILTGVATHHSYEDVKIVCVYPAIEKRQWEWVRWLPHVWDAKRERRFIACTSYDAKPLLQELAETLKIRRREEREGHAREAKPKTPFYFLLLADKKLVEDSGEQLLPESSALGMTTVYAYGDIGLLPDECQAIIDCGEPACTLQMKSGGAECVSFTPEEISHQLIDAFARSLAPIRMRSTSQAASMPGYVTFLQGYGVNRVDELGLQERWRRNEPFRSIAAPIGIRENGEIFSFDIHEKGMGPHGIVAGATRWGKSETLTTWILSVALNYPPHEVSFVLIDFKGDGLSGILLDLPHVAGIISNVDDMTSIERNLRSLQGEILRRQNVFKKTKLENIHKYQEAYRAGKVREPMAYLIIVIDEFAQLKTEYPEQMDGFISVARVGGSLGMYMVLATQSPGGIVAGQVSANSRFRICLKTSEVGESRDILGTADAFSITTRGRAYIKVGNNEVYELVQTFYSKAPYQPFSAASKGHSTKIRIVETNGERSLPEVYDKTVAAAVDDAGEGRAVAQYIKTEAGKAPSARSARPVWTAPLPEKISLSALLAGQEAFQNGVWKERNKGLSVTAGLIDDPENQTQYPLTLNFSENGHHVLYGAPSSGKTTFLQTVLLSAALSYTPEQVQFLVLDFGSGVMRILGQLPHTLIVVDANDAENIKKTEEYLLSELES